MDKSNTVDSDHIAFGCGVLPFWGGSERLTFAGAVEDTELLYFEEPWRI